MHVQRFEDPATWLARAMPLLAADEARHNLLFGITDTLINRPGMYLSAHLWLAMAGGAPAGAMLQTPPYNVLVARPRLDGALEALAGAVIQDSPETSGVGGGREEAEAFAAAWARLTGGAWRQRMAQGIYACAAALPVPEAPGTSRIAGPEDFTAILPMLLAFSDEALIAESVRDPDRIEETTRTRLGDEPTAGGIWVWEDRGRIVSISGHGGRTPSGIRIGPVYTPPEHRRRGYATNLVSAQTSWLLAGAVSTCFLYTDLTNPTSNAVYRRIGYQQVCEAVDLGFDPAPAPQPHSGGTGAASAGITT